MSDSEHDDYETAIKHAVECGDCGRDTYMYERYCHNCGHDRWGAK